MAQPLSIRRLRRSDRTAEEPSPSSNAVASAGVRKKRLAAASNSITGYGTMQTAIRAVKLGAFEYLTKPLDVDVLRIVVARAIEKSKLERQNTDLKKKIKKYSI